MPLFLTDEEFSRCSDDVSVVVDMADSYIKDLYRQIETLKAQSDASTITAEQTYSLPEQKLQLHLKSGEWAEAKREPQEERDNAPSLTLERVQTIKHTMRQVEGTGKQVDALRAVAVAEARAAAAEARCSNLEASLKVSVDLAKAAKYLLRATHGMGKLKGKAQVVKEHLRERVPELENDKKEKKLVDDLENFNKAKNHLQESTTISASQLPLENVLEDVLVDHMASYQAAVEDFKVGMDSLVNEAPAVDVPPVTTSPAVGLWLPQAINAPTGAETAAVPSQTKPIDDIEPDVEPRKVATRLARPEGASGDVEASSDNANSKVLGSSLDTDTEANFGLAITTETLHREGSLASSVTPDEGNIEEDPSSSMAKKSKVSDCLHQNIGEFEEKIDPKTDDAVEAACEKPVDPEKDDIVPAAGEETDDSERDCSDASIAQSSPEEEVNDSLLDSESQNKINPLSEELLMDDQVKSAEEVIEESMRDGDKQDPQQQPIAAEVENDKKEGELPSDMAYPQNVEAEENLTKSVMVPGVENEEAVPISVVVPEAVSHNILLDEKNEMGELIEGTAEDNDNSGNEEEGTADDIEQSLKGSFGAGPPEFNSFEEAILGAPIEFGARSTRIELIRKLNDVMNKRTKIEWVEKCLKLLGVHGVGDVKNQHIVSRLNAAVKVYVNVHGSFGGKSSGCGAVLRDEQFFPLVAWSKIIPAEECISTFYSQLKGVSLGVSMALKYHIFNLEIYSSSASVRRVVNSAWVHIMRQKSASRQNDRDGGEGRGRGRGRRTYPTCTKCVGSVINICTDCTKNVLPPDEKCTVEIHSLLRCIMSNVLELREKGLFGFHVLSPESISKRNATAEFLADLGEDREMSVAEIFSIEKLSDILFEETKE